MLGVEVIPSLDTQTLSLLFTVYHLFDGTLSNIKKLVLHQTNFHAWLVKVALNGR